MIPAAAKAQISRLPVAGSGTGTVPVIMIVPAAEVKSRLPPFGSARLVNGKGTKVTAKDPGVAPDVTSNSMSPTPTVAPEAMTAPTVLFD